MQEQHDDSQYDAEFEAKIKEAMRKKWREQARKWRATHKVVRKRTKEDNHKYYMERKRKYQDQLLAWHKAASENTSTYYEYINYPGRPRMRKCTPEQQARNAEYQRKRRERIKLDNQNKCDDNKTTV